MDIGIVTDVVVEAVGREGEQRSSMLSTAHDDRPAAPLAPGQRWGLSRKREVVRRLMQGEPVEGPSRRLGLPVYKLEGWRQQGLAGIDAGLRERDDDPQEREFVEMYLHGFGVRARHDDCRIGAALRAEGAEQPGRRGTQVLGYGGPAAAARPAPRAGILLAEPRLVLT